MCLATSILTDTPYPRIVDGTEYANQRLAGNQYKKLAYIRKRDLAAYGYLVEATKMLEGIQESITMA